MIKRCRVDSSHCSSRPGATGCPSVRTSMEVGGQGKLRQVRIASITLSRAPSGRYRASEMINQDSENDADQVPYCRANHAVTGMEECLFGIPSADQTTEEKCSCKQRETGTGFGHSFLQSTLIVSTDEPRHRSGDGPYCRRFRALHVKIFTGDERRLGPGAAELSRGGKRQTDLSRDQHDLAVNADDLLHGLPDISDQHFAGLKSSRHALHDQYDGFRIMRYDGERTCTAITLSQGQTIAKKPTFKAEEKTGRTSPSLIRPEVCPFKSMMQVGLAGLRFEHDRSARQRIDPVS
jgi:hypothetical protein